MIHEGQKNIYTHANITLGGTPLPPAPYRRFLPSCRGVTPTPYRNPDGLLTDFRDVVLCVTSPVFSSIFLSPLYLFFFSTIGYISIFTSTIGYTSFLNHHGDCFPGLLQSRLPLASKILLSTSPFLVPHGSTNPAWGLPFF